MGLMLSVLVVCVGVIEALSCLEHFQYGVIHCATNVYENARRRSSVFLKYTSKRLKLLSENSISEFDEEPEANVFQPIKFSDDSATDFQRDNRPSEGESMTIRKPKAIKLSSGSVKKLEKEDKIQIVKTLLERPRRPKTVRSISMPELIHTEKDVELTRIINDLANEPIEEINIEIEDVNPDVLSREFDELFNEYENSPDDSGFKGSPLDDTEENTNDLELFYDTKIVKPESVRSFDSRVGENEIKHFQQNLKSDGPTSKDEENDFIQTISKKPVVGVTMTNISQRISDKGAAVFEQVLSKRGLTQNGGNSRFDRSTSVDFSKVKSIMINKPVTAHLDAFSEMNNDSTEFIPDKSISHNKLEDIIFESDTPPVEVIDESFDEIYENLFDESSDITKTFQEIEKKVLGEIVSVEKEHKEGDEVSESVPEIQRNSLDEAPLEPLDGKSISNAVFLKAVEQLAELLVKDSLNLSIIKDLLRENLDNFRENFYSSDNVSDKLGTSFESLPRGRTDILHISESIIPKENVCYLKEGPDLENLIMCEEGNASQEITNDECLAEEQTKTFLRKEGNDITNARVPVAEEFEKTTGFVLCSEISNLPNVDLEVVRGESENRSIGKLENEIPNLLLNQPTPSGSYSAIAEVLDESIDSEIKVGKDVEKFFQSDGAGFENRTQRPREDDQSGRAQDGFEIESQNNTTIDVINVETEVKLNIDEKDGLTLNKLDSEFVKNDEKQGDKNSETDTPSYKGEEVDFVENLQEEKPSRQLEDAVTETITQDSITDKGKEAELIQKPPEEKPTKQHKDVRSGSVTQPDTSPGDVDASNQTVESKPTLALVKGVDYEENKEPTAVRGSIKKMDEVQSVEAVESTQAGEPVLKVHDKLEETAANMTFEQIGVVDSDLAEGKDGLESDSTKESLHAKSVVLGSFEEDEHSSESKNSSDVSEATSSAPEAFWLIFSGEYTKAMSKDWHSGHFSCWQCDEALTGQRYVLRDDHPYCIKCYESVFANVCEECNKIIGIDSKDLSYKDKHWHEACFLCNKCRVSLVDKQFGSKADKIYCGNCYDAQFASRCDGCGEIFRAGTKKMEYKTRQWHEKCFCCCVCKTPIGTKSFIPREQEIYCATCYEEKFATRCVKCNKIITSGGVTYKNEPWHRECFTCTNCNTSLAGQRFTSRDEKPYCADCFGELFAKRCTACSRPITGIGGTRFISFEDRHWHNDCFICASCKTSLVGRGFITDGDDIICPECAKQKLM